MSKIFLIGDLNSDPSSINGNKLTDFCSIHSFVSLITNPTRITQTSSKILDQCLTNSELLVDKATVLSPILNADHCVIHVELNLKCDKNGDYSRLMWDFKNANFNEYRQDLLDIDWNYCLTGDSIDQICSAWTDKILELAKARIPNKIVKIRPNDKPWYNNHLRNLRQQMWKSYKKYKRSKNEFTLARFKTLRSNYQSEVTRIKTEFEKEKFNSLTDKL